MNTKEILAERGKNYGKFGGHAYITSRIKGAIHDGIDYNKDHHGDFTYSMCEALDMIAHKIGRIVNGNPTYKDSWVDIAGYAQLIVDQLEGKDI